MCDPSRDPSAVDPKNAGKPPRAVSRCATESRGRTRAGMRLGIVYIRFGAPSRWGRGDAVGVGDEDVARGKGCADDASSRANVFFRRLETDDDVASFPPTTGAC